MLIHWPSNPFPQWQQFSLLLLHLPMYPNCHVGSCFHVLRLNVCAEECLGKCSEICMPLLFRLFEGAENKEQKCPGGLFSCRCAIKEPLELSEIWCLCVSVVNVCAWRASFAEQFLLWCLPISFQCSTAELNCYTCTVTVHYIHFNASRRAWRRRTEWCVAALCCTLIFKLLKICLGYVFVFVFVFFFKVISSNQGYSICSQSSVVRVRVKALFLFITNVGSSWHRFRSLSSHLTEKLINNNIDSTSF